MGIFHFFIVSDFVSYSASNRNLKLQYPFNIFKKIIDSNPGEHRIVYEEVFL